MYRLLPLLLALTPARVQAGLYYSGETYNDLPSGWRGFLLDQRALRQIAVAPTKEQPASTLRLRYQKEAAALAKKDKPTADDLADLGALYVRLGESAKAVQMLRAAHRDHPTHFLIAANLGTAWQMTGELTQAVAALEHAVKLAPGKHTNAEKLHLRLLRLRAREKPEIQSLDDLFAVRYLGPGDKYAAGRLAPERQKELPSAAVALAQQLALWLPGDARLLWQLAELANAHGDIEIAASMMDGCVTEFGLRHEDLLAHRKMLRDAVNDAKQVESKKTHADHALPFKPRSTRPLVTQIGPMPAIDPKKPNALAWEVIGQTTLDRKARPTFPKYLQELDGLTVVLSGHMQPINEGLGAFLLIEHPVGCWYCEMPELTYMVLVEMPEGKAASFTRDRIKVTGTLKLNANDPEKFLYLVKDARVSEE